VNVKSKIRPGFPPFSARARLRRDCFALRDLWEPRHHRCGIVVQDLRARILADLRFGKAINKRSGGLTALSNLLSR
jgi:hypothetical protein